MKYLKTIKNLLLIALFAGLLFLGLRYVTWVVRDKSLTNVWEKFRQHKKDSIDVIFIGTSHQFCSIDVDLLYEEYGVNGFMLATSGQTVPMSYYAAREAIRLQHPKKIVFEVMYCCHTFRTLTDGMSHAFFDGMPLGKVKKEAVEDLIPEGRVYYYLDLGYFHGRWKELKREDFICEVNSDRGNYHFEQITPVGPIPYLEPEETAPIPQETKEYLDKLIELCRENDVELVCYVAPFYNEESETMSDYFREIRAQLNWTGQYVEERGCRFFNAYYHLEELGIDYACDYMDLDHFNCSGQEKFTRYMARQGYFD